MTALSNLTTFVGQLSKIILIILSLKIKEDLYLEYQEALYNIHSHQRYLDGCLLPFWSV